jgi:hypothetical protein
MLKSISISPVVRAVLVIGAVMALVTGVTYAALTSSTATLTNSSVNSATANLQVSSDVGCGPSTGAFGASDTGFTFNGLVPGGAASTNETFCLKNNGTADLTLKLSVPTLPTWAVTPSGTVADNEVDVHVSCDSGAGTIDANLAALNTSAQAFSSSTLADGATAVCTINVDMNADAFTGTGASSNNFNFDFSGEAV